MKAVKALTTAVILLTTVGTAQAIDRTPDQAAQGLGCALVQIEEWTLGDIRLCGPMWSPEARNDPVFWSAGSGLTREQWQAAVDGYARRIEARKEQLRIEANKAHERAIRNGPKEIPLCVGNCR
jgi:hypothetical protein